MKLKLETFINKGETIAVALSGGSDSMALLYYMHDQANKFPFNLVAINVEHGIRGEESLSDTEFVKNQCAKLAVPLYCYSVKAIDFSNDQKLSLEQAARKLRYECFYSAISEGKCDKVATAHHADDNLESVLFNLLRGTGTKGLIGIKQNYDNKIIRPLLSLAKSDIEKYVKDNDIPFVIDRTNLSDKYSRNYLRHNVIPNIKQIFPEATESVSRLSEIMRIEDEYLDEQANNAIVENEKVVSIPIDLSKAIFYRAVFIALKRLGLEKDWEMTHADAVYSLVNNYTASRVCLPKGIVAIKEYDRIAFFKETPLSFSSVPFALGQTDVGCRKISIEKVDYPTDLKSGLFGDLDKIPPHATIRYKHVGDRFTKFGGGSKSLSDFLTDKKIPLRERDDIPLLADGKEILCIFGVAVSDKIKVDDKTKKILHFTCE